MSRRVREDLDAIAESSATLQTQESNLDDVTNKNMTSPKLRLEILEPSVRDLVLTKSSQRETRQVPEQAPVSKTMTIENLEELYNASLEQSFCLDSLFEPFWHVASDHNFREKEAEVQEMTHHFIPRPQDTRVKVKPHQPRPPDVKPRTGDSRTARAQARSFRRPSQLTAAY